MKSYPELATLLSVDLDLPDAAAGDDFLETPPTYSGSIQEVSFPKLMFHFTAARANGRLLMSNDAVRKEIFLLNGKPVAASSTLPRDKLAALLVRKGVVDKERVKQMLALVDNDDQMLADQLLHSGFMPPGDLFDHLKDQLLEKVFEVFSWRVGTYAFYDGQEFKGSLLPLNLNPWDTLTQGVRQGYELRELRMLLEPLRNRILLPRQNEHLHMGQLMLSPKETKVFRSITAGRTLGAILERLGGNPESDKATLSMIYLGIELEIIGIGDEAKDEQSFSMDDDLADEIGITAENHPEAGDEWDQMLGDAFEGDEGAGEARGHSPSTPEIAALQRTHGEIAAQNFFERLGLGHDITTKDVSKAFLKAARAYHPDQTQSDASAEVKSLQSGIFSLYNEAQQTLSDDKKRAQYLEGIEAGHDGGEVDVSNIIESEMIFQKGELLIKANKFAEALAQFEEAIKLNSEEGEFFIYRGFARFCSVAKPSNSMTTHCINEIKNGLKMRNNNVPNGYVFLGRIYKTLEDKETASRMYKKALSIQSNHVEATRELRLLNMRKSKKGLFKK